MEDELKKTPPKAIVGGKVFDPDERDVDGALRAFDRLDAKRAERKKQEESNH